MAWLTNEDAAMMHKSCGRCTRALLCVPCNFTRGWSRDNSDRLMAAAAYMLQHKGVVERCLG